MLDLSSCPAGSCAGHLPWGLGHCVPFIPDKLLHRGYPAPAPSPSQLVPLLVGWRLPGLTSEVTGQLYPELGSRP